jgi:hypothetical protein
VAKDKAHTLSPRPSFAFGAAASRRPQKSFVRYLTNIGLEFPQPFQKSLAKGSFSGFFGPLHLIPDAEYRRLGPSRSAVLLIPPRFFAASVLCHGGFFQFPPGKRGSKAALRAHSGATAGRTEPMVLSAIDAVRSIGSDS